MASAKATVPKRVCRSNEPRRRAQPTLSEVETPPPDSRQDCPERSRRDAGSTRVDQESICADFLRLRLHLSPQLVFVSRKLGLDVLCRLALPDDLLAIPPQKVIDSLDPNPDRARGLVLVQVLEAEVRSARLLDDSFDHAIDGRIVPALETRNLQRHQVRMPCRELRRPHLVVGAAGIRVLPGVADIQRVTDHTGAHLIAKQTLQQEI